MTHSVLLRCLRTAPSFEVIEIESSRSLKHPHNRISICYLRLHMLAEFNWGVVTSVNSVRLPEYSHRGLRIDSRFDGFILLAWSLVDVLGLTERTKLGPLMLLLLPLLFFLFLLYFRSMSQCVTRRDQNRLVQARKLGSAFVILPLSCWGGRCLCACFGAAESSWTYAWTW